MNARPPIGDPAILALNLEADAPWPVSVFHLPHPDTTLQVYGHVDEPGTWCLMLRGYAAARRAVHAVIGGRTRRRMPVHLYLDPPGAQQWLKIGLPFTHFPTLSIHLTPLNSLGHEVAHWVSYQTLGGRSWAWVEENFARGFADPFACIHRVAYEMVSGGGRVAQMATDALMDCLVSESLTPVSASFVRFLAERLSRRELKAVWGWPPAGHWSKAMQAGELRSWVVRWSEFIRAGCFPEPSCGHFFADDEDYHRFHAGLMAVIRRVAAARRSHVPLVAG